MDRITTDTGALEITSTDLFSFVLQSLLDSGPGTDRTLLRIVSASGAVLTTEENDL